MTFIYIIQRVDPRSKVFKEDCDISWSLSMKFFDICLLCLLTTSINIVKVCRGLVNSGG